MRRIVLSIVALLAASSALAGERIVGTNTYHVNEQNWHTGGPTGFWMQNNYGTFEVTEGPLESGSVECHGSGLWQLCLGPDRNRCEGERRKYVYKTMYIDSVCVIGSINSSCMTLDSVGPL